MIFDELQKFRKDLKILIKKFKSLRDDLEVVKKVLEVAQDERPPISYRIDNLGIETCVLSLPQQVSPEKMLSGRIVNEVQRSG